MPEKDNGGCKTDGMEPFQPPPAGGGQVLYAHDYPQDLKRNEACGFTWITTPPTPRALPAWPPLRDCATFQQRWHMNHLFSGGVLQRKHICISTPAASSCIITQINQLCWCVCVCTSTLIWHYNYHACSHAQPPPLTQSNIIRVSQWCWLEITTFFKRYRKCKIQMIWK